MTKRAGQKQLKSKIAQASACCDTLVDLVFISSYHYYFCIHTYQMLLSLKLDLPVRDYNIKYIDFATQTTKDAILDLVREVKLNPHLLTLKISDLGWV